jgi:hypothetical protein
VLRVLALASCLAVGSTARADERPLRDALSVNGTPACLDVDSVAAHVVAWLGRDLLDARLSAILEVGADDRRAGFVLLRGGDAIARREFESLPPRCEDRRAAFSLALALAIDATLLESLGIEPRAEPQPPAPEPARPPPRVEPPPPDGVELAVRIDAAASMFVGALVDPVIGASGGIALAMDDLFAVRVGASAGAADEIAISNGLATAELVALHLHGCLLATESIFAFEGCAGMSGGLVFAEGSGFEDSRTTELAWLAPSVRLVGRAPADSAIAILVAVEGFVSVLRPELEVRARDGLVTHSETLGTAGFSASLGLALSFR